mmetsp:Transcript_6735/g.9095  ORF Transcript_6735/g.9095 Transcript_6735/m.9095 type:complete len:127 (-) Transcript_6735:535-915(-)|eukprot:CAMPEP_0117757966 /NCGR_PEP_ID=MMETSP0947-20121206/15078_1 /TAXON_ID=44440 /ORGANISM="Chattonella subsalsa, Strain CCMP2191" /LENGTH=126 /DNA_ID=CAMNT_0005578025 /DNA_START=63 /DNA_END=443 /DNA_ORIENTATION=+
MQIKLFLAIVVAASFNLGIQSFQLPVHSTITTNGNNFVVVNRNTFPSSFRLSVKEAESQETEASNISIGPVEKSSIDEEDNSGKNGLTSIGTMANEALGYGLYAVNAVVWFSVLKGVAEKFLGDGN